MNMFRGIKWLFVLVYVLGVAESQAFEQTTSDGNFIVTRVNNGQPIVTEAMFQGLGATDYEAEDRGLDYQVGSATNLVEELTNATQDAGFVVLGDGFEIVTNRVPIDVHEAQFMQLKIIKE